MTAIAAEPLEFPLALYVEAPAVQPALQRLVDVVAQLRHPEDGCPWDLEQTPESLTPYILEEAYETIDAIQSGDAAAIADELGDLLLQVVLQAQIASEAQQFTLKEVAQGIAEKLVRRHPHVFGDLQVNSIEQVKANWESIKAAEQGRSPAEVQHISHRMQKDAKRFPPIVAGLKLSKQAAEAGLEWSDLGGVWEKFYEELAEFQEALLNGPTEDQLAELGDLLFTLINVARWCQLDPSAALQKTNQKLIERIRIIEGKADRPLTDYSLQELDDLWNGAKQDLAHAPSQGANSQNGQHSLPSSAAEVSS
ncbi:nucleoside triphosphate pyrophosphohydrolase [Lyngbya confervoides BDU141951]|uniref:Nucleoside triphosphate pyrophosphohydrolase n=2 Tax=Lyngbya TaxID=28073 RepID=A0ABD4T1Q2_9CYAN|nr:nucleoside triphosphate pyrophosphohydrolase [Lyngbya confervoides]MCM1982270.1 nucleoside triphosphate pyrophosphohydrolase [Lyngbya confervoides BDU141951]